MARLWQVMLIDALLAATANTLPMATAGSIDT